MQARLAGIATMRDVQVERSHRTFPARAEAIALFQFDIGRPVGGVAGIPEHAQAPLRTQPVHVLDAAHRQMASADDGIAQFNTEALIGVTAHRLVTAGAEQQIGRNAIAAVSKDRTEFTAQDQAAARAQRVKPGNAAMRAREILIRGQHLRADAQVEAEQIATGGKQGIVNIAADQVWLP